MPTVIASNEKAEQNGHPCAKPLGWMRWLVRLTSRPGETIIDSFGGAGTTGLAACLKVRKAIVIERELK